MKIRIIERADNTFVYGCKDCGATWSLKELPCACPGPGARVDNKKTEGRKDDQGKLKWSLLPWGALEHVVRVMMHGENKYSRDNWMDVDNASVRYEDAAFRHLTKWSQGEVNDPDSGLNHLAHTVCCLLFLIWFTVCTKRGNMESNA